MAEERKPLVRLPGEGWLAPGGQRIVLDGHDTGGRFTLMLPGRERPPGYSGPPAHQHAFKETFVVLRGEMTFFADDGEIALPQGGVIHVPGMASHTFANRGDEPVEVKVIASPPGIEDFMREIERRIAESNEPIEEIQRKLMAERGTRLVGRPPGAQVDPRRLP